jgi:hypothetical protein
MTLSDETRAVLLGLKSTELRNGFFPGWLFATLVACIFLGGAMYLAPLVGMFAVGFAILLGLFQWLVLWEPMTLDWTWILASIPVYAGLAITYTVHQLEPILMVGNTTLVLFLLTPIQYMVLRQFVYRAVLWNIISPGAGSVAMLACALLPVTVSPILFWVLFALIYGSITGIGIFILQKLPKPEIKL